MLVQPDKCPCCRAMLHHCKTCWDAHHHGHKDYIPPKYYGELMFDFDWDSERMKEAIKKIQIIKPDKSRRYIEGCYKH